MEKVEIRTATHEDLEAVLELYAQPGLDNGRTLPIAEAKRLHERINSYPDYRIYVALKDDTVVGSFALLIMDNLAHMGAPSGILEDVVVAPEWQGKGIGKQMIDAAMKKCRAAGCYKLVLSSNKRRVSAHEFYKKLGFEHHGYSFVVDLTPESSAATSCRE